MPDLKVEAKSRSALFAIAPEKLRIKAGLNPRDLTTPENVEHIDKLAALIAEEMVEGLVNTAPCGFAEALAERILAHQTKECPKCKAAREANVKRAEKISANCYKLNKPFRPADFGFDFTAEEYDHFLNLQEAQYEFTGEALDLYTVLEAYRNAKKAA